MITDDGARLWAVEEGDGTTLVLCHGGPGLWDYFTPVPPMLHDLVRVLRWDQRGCGRSGPCESHSVNRYIEDMETIRQALGVEHWIVAGHSWGASLALQYALSHPEQTDAVLCVSGAGIGQAWRQVARVEADRRRTVAERARFAELEARTTRTPAEESELRYLAFLPDFASRQAAADLFSLLNEAFEINIDANRQINAETKRWNEADLAARCRATTCPVLLIHGERDPRPSSALDSLAAALPHATVDLLPEVGHFPWLEAPELFRERVRVFLSRW